MDSSEEEFNNAVASAVRFLSRAAKSEAEVRQHLSRKEFTLAAQERAVDHLRNRQLIDDEKMTLRFIEANRGSKAVGDELLRQKLQRRGLTAPPLGVTGEDLLGEASRAASVLSKKYSQPVEFGKAARFLAGRGFSEEAIQNALENFPFVIQGPLAE